MVIGLRRTVAIRGPRVRIETGIPQEIVAVAVEDIRAGLGHDVDDGSAGLRVLGPEEVRLHLEFLHRIHRRCPLQVRGPGVLLGGVDDRAVHEHVRGGIAGAVRNEIRIAGADGARGAVHARRQIQQCQRVPRNIRKRQHVPVLDHLSQSRDGSVQKRRLARNVDRRREFTHFQ